MESASSLSSSWAQFTMRPFEALGHLCHEHAILEQVCLNWRSILGTGLAIYIVSKLAKRLYQVSQSEYEGDSKLFCQLFRFEMKGLSTHLYYDKS